MCWSVWLFHHGDIAQSVVPPLASPIWRIQREATKTLLIPKQKNAVRVLFLSLTRKHSPVLASRPRNFDYPAYRKERGRTLWISLWTKPHGLEAGRGRKYSSCWSRCDSLVSSLGQASAEHQARSGCSPCAIPSASSSSRQPLGSLYLCIWWPCHYNPPPRPPLDRTVLQHYLPSSHCKATQKKSKQRWDLPGTGKQARTGPGSQSH